MKTHIIAAIALLFVSVQSNAYFIDGDDSQLNGNEVIDFSAANAISFDANFSNSMPMQISVQREALDTENIIGLSAVVNNFTGFGWSGFLLRVFDGAALVQAGDVFAFTAVAAASSSLDAGIGLIGFDIDEFAGFELGDVFGDFGVSPFLIDVSSVGESFGIEFAPIAAASAAVPTPATAMLLGCAVFGLGLARRR